MEKLLKEQGQDINISNSDFCIELTRNSIAKVLLSIPHDGSNRHEFGNMFKTRRNSTMVRDMHTWPIGRDIFSQTNSVAAVRGILPRTLVDYNRTVDFDETELAYEDPLLSGFYDAYHDAICSNLKAAIDEYGHRAVLLLDVHGFSRQPEYAPNGGYDCVLGTGNRGTIIHDNVDIEFSQHLENHGYKVFLPKNKPVRSDRIDNLNAGHITRHYSRQFGINAIQIEIASHIRDSKNPEISKQFASDVSDFINQKYK